MEKNLKVSKWLRESYKLIPKRPYEITYKQFLILGAFATSTYGLLFNGIYSTSPFEIRVLAGLLCLAGNTIDHQTTLAYFNAAKDAVQNKIIAESQAGDNNPLIPTISSPEHFNSSKRVKMIEVGLITLGLLVPGVGIPLAAMKTLAGLNNYRNALRFNKAVELKNTIN